MERSLSQAWARLQTFKVMIVTGTILAFAVMNGTMFNVAIPDIATSFELTPGEVSWVVTSFTTVFAVGTFLYGKLADMISLRQLFTVGLGLFSFGSVLGLLAPTYETLILARILQAMGASSVPPLAFLVPVRLFPSKQGMLLGYLASIIAFASGIGPVIGGTVGGWVDWRAIFTLSITSAALIPLVRRWFPKEPFTTARVDWLGALLMGAGVTGVLLTITTFHWSFLLGAVLLFAGLGWRIHRVPYALIHPATLRNRAYVVTLVASFAGNMISFGLIFLLPLMLRDVYGLSTVNIGWVLCPGAIVAAVIGRWMGREIARKGGHVMVGRGFLFLAMGSWFLSTFAAVSPVWAAGGLALAYMGFPMIQSGTPEVISSQVAPAQHGEAMGLFNLLNFFAGAFSSALFGTVLERGTGNFSLNPLMAASEGALYSNIYAVFTMLGIGAWGLFVLSFRRQRGFLGNR